MAWDQRFLRPKRRGAFTPASLTSLILWASPVPAQGVYSDAGTTPVTDGQTIYRNQARFPLDGSIDFDQATSGNRPRANNNVTTGWEMEFYQSASNTYLAAADANVLDLTGDMSLAAWVNLDASNTNRWIVAKALWGGDASGDYWLKTDDSNGLKINGMLYTSATFEKATSSAALTAGVWAMVGFSVSGTTLQTYINGVADGTPLTITGTRSANTHNLHIGGGVDGNPALDGRVKDVFLGGAVWSAAEWLNLYNFGYSR
jgi:hypothetical protein